MRTCRKCGVEKDLSEFPVRSDTGKHRSECRDCRTKDNLNRYHTKESTKEAHARAALKHSLKKYGLTVEQYNEMQEKQSGRCAICNQPEEQDRRLAVDHCHATGKVRALLCQSCNTGLGLFRDSEALLMAAANYLQSTR